MISDKTRLRIPGPTPIPPRVTRAMSQAMIGHRSQECSRMVEELSHRLKPLFGTTEPVMILTSSGTSALEAAVVNTVQPGDEVIVVVTGAFGDRFANIAERYQAQVHRLDIPWGQACTAEQLTTYLKQYPKTKMVFATYCETSTGVLNPIPELAAAVREHSDALLAVDGVSAIGGAPFDMEAWGVDIAVTGSQKCLMLPAGLAFVAVNQRALERIHHCPTPRFYLDLRTYHKNLLDSTTPYTPAISLLFGLQEALTMLEEEGLEEVFRRHRLMRDMTLAGLKALGLPLLADERYASPTVTAVRGIPGASATQIRDIAKKKFQMTLAGGQKHLKTEIFRIGHMGYCDPLDVLSVLSVLELALYELNVPVTFGQAVKAAQEVMTGVSSPGQ